MNRFSPLWSLLNRTDRRRFVALASGSSILAFLDMVGITMVFPLVILLATPDNAEPPPMVSRVMDLAGTATIHSTVVLLVGLILAAFVVRGVSSIFVIRSTLKLAFLAEASMAERLVRAFLEAPLLYHLSSNTAAAQRTIHESLRQVYEKGLIAVIPASGDLAVVVLVSIILIVIAPLEAALGALCLAVVILVYRRVAGRRAELASERILQKQEESLLYIQQSLTAVKEIQIRGSTDVFAADLLRVREESAGEMARVQLIEYLPRYLIEMGMVASAALVGSVAFFRNPPDRALAILVIFAAAIVRVLPSLNRVMVALMHLTSVQPAISLVNEVLDELDSSGVDSTNDLHPLGANERFEKLEMRQVAFCYPDTATKIINSAELSIHRGDYIGIVGSSGAGKTTLLNLMLGFFEPTAGSIMVNGIELGDAKRSWRTRIGYVPQDVAFLDGTIAENVALDTRSGDIDRTRVRHCLDVGQLAEMVAGLPMDIDTPVREAGSRLSGGQRQRLGLARALYSEPEVLILDEATSSLDDKTESTLLDAVDKLADQLTIIVVAHRKTTVDRCRRIVSIDDGHLSEERNSC